MSSDTGTLALRGDICFIPGPFSEKKKKSHKLVKTNEGGQKLSLGNVVV